MKTLGCQGKVLIIICSSALLCMLQNSILYIANPTIASDFAINLSTVQWIVTSYLLVITATLLLFGRLGDYVGIERMYFAGLATFLLGSIFCLLSFSFIWLLLARIFTAFGASMVMSNEFAIILKAFPKKEQGKATGMVFAAVGVGQMLGPGLGGLLLGYFNWHSIFVVSIIIVAGTLFMAYKALDFTRPVKRSWNGKVSNYALLGAVLVLLMVGISAGRGWSRLYLAGAAILVFSLFYLLDRRTNEAILDYSLFKIRPFVFGGIMVMISYAAMAGISFLMPFFLQDLVGYSTAKSGLLMMICPLFVMISAPLAGAIYDKFGSRFIMVFSFVSLAFSFLLFSQLTASASTILLGVALCLLGIGFASCGPACYNEMFAAAPSEKGGYVGSFIAVLRTFANALGPSGGAALFTLFISRAQLSMPYEQAYVQAHRSVSFIFLGVAVLGVVLAVGIHGKVSNSKIAKAESN